jgi:hypothetical protein
MNLGYIDIVGYFTVSQKEIIGNKDMQLRCSFLCIHIHLLNQLHFLFYNISLLYKHVYTLNINTNRNNAIIPII